MRKFQKRASLFVSLSLIITFALLMHVNFARAEEIIPGVDFVTLLAGQDADFNTSQTDSLGSHSAGVLSLGNKSLTAKVTVSTDDVIGLWWVTLWGTAASNFFGYAYGLAFPSGGESASVNLDDWIGLGFATGGVIAISEVSVQAPIKYKLNMKGNALD